MKFWRWICWWMPPVLLRVCVINLVDDQASAIRGVLWSSRGPWLVFRQCSLLKAGAEPVPLDGDVIIHRDRLFFLQAVD